MSNQDGMDLTTQKAIEITLKEWAQYYNRVPTGKENWIFSKSQEKVRIFHFGSGNLGNFWLFVKKSGKSHEQ